MRAIENPEMIQMRRRRISLCGNLAQHADRACGAGLVAGGCPRAGTVALSARRVPRRSDRASAAPNLAPFRLRSTAGGKECARMSIARGSVLRGRRGGAGRGGFIARAWWRSGVARAASLALPSGGGACGEGRASEERGSLMSVASGLAEAMNVKGMCHEHW